MVIDKYQKVVKGMKEVPTIIGHGFGPDESPLPKNENIFGTHMETLDNSHHKTKMS